MSRRCKSKHRKCWVWPSNTHVFYWCYECGAINSWDVANDKWMHRYWTYPVGPDRENPALMSYSKYHPLKKYGHKAAASRPTPRQDDVAGHDSPRKVC